jgi:hypothetical protein
MSAFIDRHQSIIGGVLGCFDRVVVQGTLPGICYADGMTALLDSKKIRIFDYPRFAEPFRDAIRADVDKVASAAGVTIEFIRKIKGFRKEDRIQQIIAERGGHPGLVHIFSAMEACMSYKPWHNKVTGQTFLRYDTGKCVHYYFYFIDPILGLCYLRIPTWCPFRAQFYFNGHNWLASKLRARKVDFEMLDNAFASIADWKKAQQISDDFNVSELHSILDAAVSRYCPALAPFGRYHWSIMQVEYATDIVFRSTDELHPLYDHLSRTAIHAIKAADVATFLGRSLTSRSEQEAGASFSTRIEGTRVRHYFGPASIKMYDKHGFILRVETTANDVTFFHHHRTVEQKDGKRVMKLAPVKKSIYSLSPDLISLLSAANERYLQFLSSIDDPTPGLKTLTKLSTSVQEGPHTYRGFNFFDDDDQTMFETLCRGEFLISGIRNKTLRQHLASHKPAQVSRLLKRLRLHGILKKVGKTYKYYLTELGRHVAVAGLTLKTMFLVPEFASAVLAY